MKKIVLVAGARPNFMKIAPLLRAFKSCRTVQPILVHTGQHYDTRMSDTFFADLHIPQPDINLEVGSASHAVQTAEIMKRFELFLLREKSIRMVIVVGDVNSTVACALVAVKMGIPVAHVESGLRSFDRSMPEEINRIVTDHLSDYLFTTCREASVHLLKEGILRKKIYFVGNVMIDTLVSCLDRIKKGTAPYQRPYAVLTVHRPSNVDEKPAFRAILEAMKSLSSRLPVVFPCHPRTLQRIQTFGFQKYLKYLVVQEPLGYIDFMRLMYHASMVFTDSGGIQEETAVLNVPCITLRENTERPITLACGKNVLVGTQTNKIVQAAEKILAHPCVSQKKKKIP